MTSLTERAESILKLVIESYIQTGDPVGSKTIAEHMGLTLSSASIRNVMADLERGGYLYAPHTSAGRLPTEAGLTVFVEGLLEVSTLGKRLKSDIKQQLTSAPNVDVDQTLDHASRVISGLSEGAGLIIAPKEDSRIREVEFLKLSSQRILCILVQESGQIENRILELAEDIPASSLRQASNYVNDVLSGHSLADIQKELKRRMEADKDQLDSLTQKLIDAGIAEQSPKDTGQHLIIRGQASLLESVTAIEDLERLRRLFTALEEKDTLSKMLDSAAQAEGVQIFIGSNNSLFEHSGCSLILSPYRNKDKEVVGALGVIGPTRLNYRRVIPVIDYTSEILGELL